MTQLPTYEESILAMQNNTATPLQTYIATQGIDLGYEREALREVIEDAVRTATLELNTQVQGQYRVLAQAYVDNFAMRIWLYAAGTTVVICMLVALKCALLPH